jgi:hypothetical protein
MPQNAVSRAYQSETRRAPRAYPALKRVVREQQNLYGANTVLIDSYRRLGVNDQADRERPLSTEAVRKLPRSICA